MLHHHSSVDGDEHISVKIEAEVLHIHGGVDEYERGGVGEKVGEDDDDDEDDVSIDACVSVVARRQRLPGSCPSRRCPYVSHNDGQQAMPIVALRPC